MNILIGKQCKKKTHGATFNGDLVEVVFLLYLCLGGCFQTRTIKHKLEQYEHVNKEDAHTAMSKIN